MQRFIIMLLILALCSGFTLCINFNEKSQDQKYLGNWGLIENNKSTSFYREMFIDENFIYTYSYDYRQLLLPIRYYGKSVDNLILLNYSPKDTVGNLRVQIIENDTLKIESFGSYGIFVRIKDEITLEKFIRDSTVEESQLIKSMSYRRSKLHN